MNEEEWLACDTLTRMLPFLGERAPSERKLRLYACGCCRLVPEYMESGPDRMALELTERDVDDAVDEDAFNSLADVFDIRWYRRSGWNATYRAIETYREQVQGNRSEAVLADLVRDIFGNPFRPVAFDPAWRTATAVSLARQMYEAREFSAMPILADALQDAGCDSAAVLDHCREPNQVHVRGCWVVDLVLGKG